MPSLRAILPFVSVLPLVTACSSPPAADEEDSTEDEAADTEAGGVESCEDRTPGEFFSYTLVRNGAPLPDEEFDIDRNCMIFDDNGAAKLSLDCGDFGFELSLEGEAAEAMGAVDLPGEDVHVRFVQNFLFNYIDRWLRIDYLGHELSIYLIDASSLQPAGSWAIPWGLAVGESCVSDPGVDLYAESLVLERDGETLELWQGESGQNSSETLKVWVDRSLRDGPDAPPGDGPTAWKQLVIVSYQPAP